MLYFSKRKVKDVKYEWFSDFLTYCLQHRQPNRYQSISKLKMEYAKELEAQGKSKDLVNEIKRADIPRLENYFMSAGYIVKTCSCQNQLMLVKKK